MYSFIDECRSQSSHTCCYSYSQSVCLYCLMFCPAICDLSLAKGTNFAAVLKSLMDLGKLWLNWRWEQELLLYVMFVTHPNLPFFGKQVSKPTGKTNKEHYTSIEKRRGDTGAHFILLTTRLLPLPVTLTWTLLKSTEQIFNPPESLIYLQQNTFHYRWDICVTQLL